MNLDVAGCSVPGIKDTADNGLSGVERMTLPRKTNCRANSSLDAHFQPALSRTAAFEMRDKCEGRMRKMVRRHLAWKPSSLLSRSVTFSCLNFINEAVILPCVIFVPIVPILHGQSQVLVSTPTVPLCEAWVLELLLLCLGGVSMLKV